MQGRTRACASVLHALLLASISLSAPSGHAAEPGPLPPALDPGQTLEQREREREAYEAPGEDAGGGGVEVERPAGRFALPEGTGRRFVLKGIRLNESAFIAARRIQQLAEPYMDREVTFAEVNELVRSINAIYKELGQVTARAIVPPQRIKNGILRIQLVEGRLGSVELRGMRYTDEDFVRGLVPVEPGAVIDVPALQSRVQAANRLLPFRLGAQLRAGESFAESDVVMGVREPQRYVAQAFVDNNGSESTGELQYGVQAIWNGPRGRGDRLSVYAVDSEGASSLDVTYAMAHRATGGVLSINLAGSDTQIIGGDFAGFGITGGSTQVGVAYRVPAATRDAAVLDGIVRLGWLEAGNAIGARDLSENRVRRVGVGVRVEGRAALPRWSVQPELLFETTESLDGAREHTYRFNGEFSHASSGPLGALLRVRGRWQYARERQPSPLQFSAGGTGSVRGFRGSAVSGDRGLSVSGELHWAPEALSRHGIGDVFTFFDAGYADGVSGPGRSIRGLGVGAAWSGAGWSLSATAGMPIDGSDDAQRDEYVVQARLTYRFGGG